MTHYELGELVELLLRVGQAMLRAGAASFRTEETITRLGIGLGADRIEGYVTPTGLVITAVSGTEERTRVGHVGLIGVNMAQIVALDQLSREVSAHGATIAGGRDRLEEILARPRELPDWLLIPAVGIACGAFCVNLGGGGAEFLAAAAGAGLAQWLRLVLYRRGVNFLILTVLCALVASLTAWLVGQAVPGDAPTLGLIASVLLLVPGVLLVTAVIDLTQYDLVSGIVRGALALIVTVSIGFGMVLTLWITGTRILP